MTILLSPAASHRPAPFTHLAEADLWRLWEGQRFPPGALKTTGGVPLRAVYRGRPNHGPGPDFRDAIIASPDGLLAGDIELHVRSSDFRRHGHAVDPAYDRVVLHLVFRHDAEGDTTLSSGRRVPVVALEDWTERRAREVQRWLLRGARYEEPCRSAVARLGPEAAGAALDRLGDMRFRAKAHALAKRAGESGPGQALWEGLLEALAYGGERERFVQVARAVPWRLLDNVLSGMAPSQRAAAAEGLLLAAYSSLPPPPVGSSPARGGRPAARPEHRLHAAAVVASRLATSGPAATLLGCLPDDSPPAVRLRRLLALFTVPGAAGRGRAVEIAANVALPYLTAPGREREALALYAALPLPARYGNVRHLHSALAGEVPLAARRQQGMLYLLNQYCTQGGCGKCPLS